MTVHVISVGLSIKNSLADPRASLPGGNGLARAVEQARPGRLLSDDRADSSGQAASDWLSRALAKPGDGPEAERLAGTVAKIQPDLWPARLSAELDTFVRAPAASFPLAATDIAVLVCSDTPDGLLSGVWNAAALAGGELSRVRYLADPGGPLDDVRGCAAVVRIESLDASSQPGFAQAMSGLGILGRRLLDSGVLAVKEPFCFYLSGGFKASIPYLIGLAEGLASLPEAGPVQAFVLHETARDRGPVQLPLRRIAAERVWRELDGLSLTPIAVEPESDYLDGYAYEKGPGGWRLTAFGAGLKALFGERPAPGLL